jgi:hypothetical protein
MDDSWDEECLKLDSSLLHQGQGRLQARRMTDVTTSSFLGSPTKTGVHGGI